MFDGDQLLTRTTPKTSFHHTTFNLTVYNHCLCLNSIHWQTLHCIILKLQVNVSTVQLIFFEKNFIFRLFQYSILSNKFINVTVAWHFELIIESMQSAWIRNHTSYGVLKIKPNVKWERCKNTYTCSRIGKDLGFSFYRCRRICNYRDGCFCTGTFRWMLQGPEVVMCTSYTRI